MQGTQCAPPSNRAKCHRQNRTIKANFDVEATVACCRLTLMDALRCFPRQRTPFSRSPPPALNTSFFIVRFRLSSSARLLRTGGSRGQPGGSYSFRFEEQALLGTDFHGQRASASHGQHGACGKGEAVLRSFRRDWLYSRGKTLR